MTKRRLIDSGLTGLCLASVMVFFLLPAVTVASPMLHKFYRLQELGDIKRPELRWAVLMSNRSLDKQVTTAAFKPPDKLTKPINRFKGRLVLSEPIMPEQIEVLKDTGNRAENPGLKLASLPPLDIGLAQSGNDLIPLVRGAQASSHPYWEWMVEPGQVWDEPGDFGYSRAVLPFSLRQRNANCTHNGLMTFVFRSTGEISRVVYQVGSETCIYLQVDLWGKQQASYVPGIINGSAEAITAFREEKAARLPVKNISELNLDYPGVDPSNFIPASTGDTTVYGLVIDGVNYMGGCDTRHGPHPFCDRVDLPSYSTSKSTFAGLAFMYLVREYPGFAGEKIIDWVPECAATGQWNDVTFADAVNMQTGVYTSAKYMVDEDNTAGTAFFTDDTHAAKISYSCTAHTRKSAPNQQWVYQSSTTYVLGTAMNNYLKAKTSPGHDLYADILVMEFWLNLGLSGVTWETLRTYDELAQPFTGYGMTYLPDDIARIALFLNTGDARLNGISLLDESEFSKAMQRGEHIPVIGLDSRNLNYQNGFWAVNAANWIGCPQDTWVPFMSGYGGITVALLPNDTVYYVFSDSGNFQWAKAAAEADTLRSYCGD